MRFGGSDFKTWRYSDGGGGDVIVRAFAKSPRFTKNANQVRGRSVPKVAPFGQPAAKRSV